MAGKSQHEVHGPVPTAPCWLPAPCTHCTCGPAPDHQAAHTGALTETAVGSSMKCKVPGYGHFIGGTARGCSSVRTGKFPGFPVRYVCALKPVHKHAALSVPTNTENRGTLSSGFREQPDCPGMLTAVPGPPQHRGLLPCPLSSCLTPGLLLWVPQAASSPHWS